MPGSLYKLYKKGGSGYLDDRVPCVQHLSYEVRRVAIENKCNDVFGHYKHEEINPTHRSRYTCVIKKPISKRVINSSSSELFIPERCTGEEGMKDVINLTNDDDRREVTHDLKKGHKNKEMARLLRPESLRKKLIGKAHSDYESNPSLSVKHSEESVVRFPLNVTDNKNISKQSIKNNSYSKKQFEIIAPRRSWANSKGKSVTDSKVSSTSNAINNGNYYLPCNYRNKNFMENESDVDSIKCIYGSKEKMKSKSLIDVAGQVSEQFEKGISTVGNSELYRHQVNTFQNTDNYSDEKLIYKFKPLQDKYENLSKSSLYGKAHMQCILNKKISLSDADYEAWLKNHKFLNEKTDLNHVPNNSICSKEASIANNSHCDDDNIGTDITSISQQGNYFKHIQIIPKSSFNQSLLVEQNILWDSIKFLNNFFNDENIVIRQAYPTNRVMRFIVIVVFSYFLVYFDNLLPPYDRNL